METKILLDINVNVLFGHFSGEYQARNHPSFALRSPAGGAKPAMPDAPACHSYQSAPGSLREHPVPILPLKIVVI
jgi:hypothetical protein